MRVGESAREFQAKQKREFELASTVIHPRLAGAFKNTCIFFSFEVCNQSEWLLKWIVTGDMQRYHAMLFPI